MVTAAAARACASRLAALALVCAPLHAPLEPCAAETAPINVGFKQVAMPCPDGRVVCVSSLDPAHFEEPWEIEDANTASQVLARIESLCASMGGTISSRTASSDGLAVRVSWTDDGDETLFFLPADDAVVHFRSEAVGDVQWDRSRNKRRLETMRKTLRLAKVPVVRNRRAEAGERQADGEYRLREERPWLQPPGERRLYGEDGEMKEDAAGPLRMLFPFERVGARGSAPEALIEDLRDLSAIEELRKR